MLVKDGSKSDWVCAVFYPDYLTGKADLGSFRPPAPETLNRTNLGELALVMDV